MWRPGIGSIAHFITGLVAGFFSVEAPAVTISLTLLFIFYQWLDWSEEGGGKYETIEYMIGLLTGLIIEIAIFTIT